MVPTTTTQNVYGPPTGHHSTAHPTGNPQPQQPSAPSYQPDADYDNDNDNVSISTDDKGKNTASGEQRIYSALLDLSASIDTLADKMKSYPYPTQEQVEIKLKQGRYSYGGLQKKKFIVQKNKFRMF